MNGAETSRVKRHGFSSQKSSAEGDQTITVSDESEDTESIDRRAVRKFPEEANEELIEHHHAFIPEPRTTCICPEVLTKGTLVAIVASLACLGFFSTLILLLVAIIILRLMERHWKKEKKMKDVPPARPPPIPRRPTETLYEAPKNYGVYKEMHPTRQSMEGTYLDPAELHPGPRLRQEGKYMSPQGTGTEPKSTPERNYTTVQSPPRFSTSTPENVYTSVLGPQTERIYANADETQSGSMADNSLAIEEQMKGPEEHIYEEIN